MLRLLTASLAVALSACATVEGELQHVSTLPPSRDCHDARPTVAVLPGSKRIALEFQQSGPCQRRPIAVYRQERHVRLDDRWRIGLSSVAGFAAVGAVAARLAAEAKPERWADAAYHQGERNLTNTLTVMAGATGVVAVGTLVYAVTGAISVPLPPRERAFELDVTPEPRSPATGRISGVDGVPLGVSDEEGVLVISLDDAAAVARGELYIDGTRAELMSGSAGRLWALPACRRALAGFDSNPDQPPLPFDSRRADAERCAASGWSFADAVLAFVTAPHSPPAHRKRSTHGRD